MTNTAPQSARPPGLTRQFGVEFRRTFTSRRGWLIAFGAHLALAAIVVAFTHYDTSRSALSTAGLAAEIAAFVIADTLTTNQLGDDSEYVLAVMDQARSVLRLLVLKNLVLASLLLPITIAISIATRIDLTRLHDLDNSVTEDLLDVFVVLLWLGVGSVTSVLLPYKPIPLRERRRLRSTWPRWIACLAVPYLALFLVLPELSWPPTEIARQIFTTPRSHLVEYAGTYTVWGVVVWAAGLGLASLYVRLKSRRLAADLRRTA